MEDVAEMIERISRQRSEQDMLKVFIAMVMSIIDKIRPPWEKDVRLTELGIKIEEVAINFFLTTEKRASEARESEYQRQKEVLRHWFLWFNTPAQLRRADAISIDAANDVFNRHMVFFLTTIDRFGPLLFSDGGIDKLASLVTIEA